MSQEIKESLMYDFAYNLFLVNIALPNMRNVQDRQNVVQWIRFLKNNVRTIKEMQIRNDFMYFLVLNVQEGTLKSPFDKPPPKMPITSITNLLPTDATEIPEDMDNTSLHGHGRKSEIFRRSPDGEEFLISQPIPDVGAFCYLAVVTKNKK